MSLINSLIQLDEITQAKEEFLKKLFYKYFPWAKDSIYGYFSDILELDNTENKIYVQWLLNKGLHEDYIVKKNNDNQIRISLLIEDTPRIQDALDLYHKVKNRGDFPKEYRDINSISSLSKLYEIIKPFNQYSKSGITAYENIMKNLKQYDDYSLLYEDDEYIVVRAYNEKASCIIGTNSEWCTAWGEYSTNKKYKDRTNYFDNYNTPQLMSIIHKSDDSKSYQIEFSKGEWRDLNDKSYQPIDLLQKLPDGIRTYIINRFNKFLTDEYPEKMVIQNIDVENNSFIVNVHRLVKDNTIVSFKTDSDFIKADLNSTHLWFFISNETKGKTSKINLIYSVIDDFSFLKLILYQYKKIASADEFDLIYELIRNRHIWVYFNDAWTNKIIITTNDYKQNQEIQKAIDNLNSLVEPYSEKIIDRWKSIWHMVCINLFFNLVTNDDISLNDMNTLKDKFEHINSIYTGEILIKYNTEITKNVKEHLHMVNIMNYGRFDDVWNGKKQSFLHIIRDSSKYQTEVIDFLEQELKKIKL